MPPPPPTLRQKEHTARRSPPRYTTLVAQDDANAADDGRISASTTPRLRAAAMREDANAFSPSDTTVSSEHSLVGDHLREQQYGVYYASQRHTVRGGTTVSAASAMAAQNWRIRERMKTVSAALVVCLNIGVDPPDVVKTNPCARLECWIDPLAVAAPKAIDNIGKNLQTQYEVWQPRARYKQLLDPTAEEAKKLCTGLRRSAKDDRILFHYNGHGVPRPTSNGELWVFNKNFTQYIPVSIYDVQSWLGAPSIFVYDCSGAGHLLQAFNKYAEQRDSESMTQRAPQPAVKPVTVQHSGSDISTAAAPPNPVMCDCIQLAACAADQILPMNPDMPADIFTSCLTTPIEMALRFFALQNRLITNVTPEMIGKIPGRLSDRRTPLGELNWIFTAITDTIAWNSLPPELFKRLFRQDLMVAALFRNFLLAERIMRKFHCTPLSMPRLPQTHHHPLWNAWDLAADFVLAQLPGLLDATQPAEYVNSSFFAEQLTAFEVWLDKGGAKRKPPEQLPVVLQVLLSQAHRLRALVLLGKFLNLGAWAVEQALAVGIFPYVLKLLQSPAAELKSILVFIWSRLLSVDPTCQHDLLKENGYQYFVALLAPNTAQPTPTPVPSDGGLDIGDLRGLCTFILSVFCRGFRNGQQACLNANVLTICLGFLDERDDMLRQWSLVCLGHLWDQFPDAKAAALQESAHEKLFALLQDASPDIRSAALYALGLFLGDTHQTDSTIQLDQAVGLAVLNCVTDASPLVRKELTMVLSKLVALHFDMFVTTAFEYIEEERQKTQTATQTVHGPIKGFFRSSLVHHSFYSCIWKVLLNLTQDPVPEISELAMRIVDSVNASMLLLHEKSLADLLASLAVSPTSSTMTMPHFASRTMIRRPPMPFAEARRSLRVQSSTSSFSLYRSKSSALKQSGSLGASSSYMSEVFSVPMLPSGEVKRPKSQHDTMAKIGVTPPRQLSRSDEMAAPSSSLDAQLGEELPLPSHYFEQCLSIFSQAHLKPDESGLPGSEAYTSRIWRRRRNETVVRECRLAQSRAFVERFDVQLSVLETHCEIINALAFHPFDDQLVFADTKNNIGVWQWQHKQRLNQFPNGNPTGSNLTTLQLINTHDEALLMTGSDDGVVRIFRDYDKPNEMKMVSSWWSLTDMLPDETGSGLVMEWQQVSGSLLVSGDVKTIKIWDAAREEIPTRSASCVTSLTSDQQLGNLLIAGCGDGAIRLYDKRLAPKDAMVLTFNEHPSWVINVHLQRGNERKLISGSTNGDVRFWDSRYSNAVKVVEMEGMGSISALVQHDYSPYFAAGSQNQSIKVYDTGGDCISTIRYHEGFFGQRIAPVNAMAFHPQKMVFAAGGMDQLISIYGVNKNSI